MIRLFRAIALVLLVVSLHGCTRWRLVADAKDLSAKPLGTVRLTTNSDPRHWIVKDPTISGDSVVWSLPTPGGIPLNEVEWVEARAPDRMATGFFVLVVVGFSTLIAVLQ